ncbi:MAG: hypothetical protein WBN99_17440 [Mycobacterium sp.]|nr:hypothetical protein [Mycobacterium sp.]
MSDGDWTTPAALAIPKEGYFELERGRYGPVYPKTPACHGFSIIAKVKEGREDVVRLFSATGITTIFTQLEGFPEDWKENPEAFIKFVRDHQVPSFLEYGEYPYVTADEIKKALKLKAAFSTMLDQMQ